MKIKINRIQCFKCKHQWVPRKKDVRQCPKCKTAYWNEKNENIKNRP